jgi:L-alanine-DL-glutamate epimerase-like enolase superfamily enzyme
LRRLLQPAIDVRPYRLQLRSAVRRVDSREGFVVELRADGLIGRGEACIAPEIGTETAAECLAELSRPDPRTPAARHAIELARLDLEAQRANVPLCKLLDARAAAEVTCSALLVAEGNAELAREAGALSREGFATLKLKVGHDDDFARAAVVRDAVGPSVKLRLDANGAWTPAVALDRLQELAPLDIELCEQPTLDLVGLETSPVPIAADELVALDAEQAFQRAAIVVLKPMALGGVLPALRLAQRAISLGKRVLVTTSLDGAIARAGAAHLAAALLASGPQPAAGLATGRLLDGDLCEDLLAPQHGAIRIPSTPGLGL